ncbi:hemolysin D [Alginatibacterium sediminis]|uniref:Hemolysin D n=1 Tax=Alginatibacterium sediminis TaxID=2164068 RepID=A0A420EGA0_9ALTE|nr:efflux RND transporter periplasmic adaptor subunit [Alginatibacterium sediminis]RKF19693.1 hemolysin D [Alginatibacterium sediminis]
MKEIMLPYILIIWVLVKLGIITWNMRNAVISVGLGCFIAFTLFASHRFWSPADLTDSATIKAPHAVLSPLIGQEIDQVFVDHNQSVSKGDPIYSLVDIDSSEKVSALKSQIVAAQHEIKALELVVQNDQRNLQRLTTLNDYASQSSRDDLAATIASNLAKIVAANANIEAKRSEITAANWQQGRREIRAPFDGQLSIVNIVDGTRVGNMHLYDSHNKFLEMRIPDQAYSNIEEGQFAEFFVEAYPGEIFRGRVHSLRTGTGEAMLNARNGDQHVRGHVAQNQGSHGRTVIIEFDQPEGYDIPIGSTGSAWISANKPHSILGFMDIIGAATVRLKAMKAYLLAL